MPLGEDFDRREGHRVIATQHTDQAPLIEPPGDLGSEPGVELDLDRSDPGQRREPLALAQLSLAVQSRDHAPRLARGLLIPGRDLGIEGQERNPRFIGPARLEVEEVDLVARREDRRRAEGRPPPVARRGLEGDGDDQDASALEGSPEAEQPLPTRRLDLLALHAALDHKTPRSESNPNPRILRVGGERTRAGASKDEPA